jgi:hypothetical protein
MEYITHHTYDKKPISGQCFIARGTIVKEHTVHIDYLNSDINLLCYGANIICAARSLNGRIHFSRNDDKRGLERGDLTYSIAYAPRERVHSDGHVFRFSEEELKLLENKYSHWLRQIEPLLFNDAFFDAEVEDLQKLADELGIKKGGESDVQNH